MVLRKWPPHKEAPQRADDQEAPSPFAKLNDTCDVVREYPETIATNKGPNGASIKQRTLRNKHEFAVLTNRFFST